MTLMEQAKQILNKMPKECWLSSLTVIGITGLQAHGMIARHEENQRQAANMDCNGGKK